MTEMVSSCIVIFVKLYIIWPITTQKKHDLYYTQEVIFFQADFDHPEQIKKLASEFWNTAVLDSRATNTVAGKEWYNCHISSLSFMRKQK